MKLDQFMSVVLAPSHTTDRCEALTSLLDTSYHELELMPAGVEQRREQMKNLLDMLDCLEGLQSADLRKTGQIEESDAAMSPVGLHVRLLDDLGVSNHRLQLIDRGCMHWRSLVLRFRHEHHARVRRCPFEAANAGHYPFRDFEHGVIQVRSASPVSAPANSGRCYDYANVALFTDPNASQSERSALYHDRLEVKTITEADLRSPSEHALVGQQGVFARKDIPAGTCIGVYGGQILGTVDTFILEDKRYIMLVSDEGERICINGEGMLSLTNTVFEVGFDGKVMGHPSAGYNIEMAGFPAQLDHGWAVYVPACFTTEDVVAGQELRWNYALNKI